MKRHIVVCPHCDRNYNDWYEDSICSCGNGEVMTLTPKPKNESEDIRIQRLRNWNMKN